jgi:drug/metabolite transporter (DMT)-like permease
MKVNDVLNLLLLSALWGASFLFMRIAVPELGPVVLADLRMVIAGLFLLPIILRRAGPGELRTHWQKLATVGTLNSAIPFILLPYSTLYLSGGFASILNATSAIFAALIAWVWLSTRLNVSRIAGFFIGFAGVVVLVWNKASFDTSGVSLAIIAAIVASFFYGVGANFTRRYLQGVSPIAIATGSQLGAAVILLPAALALWPAGPISGQAWAAIIAMGIVSTGVAYIIYFRLIASVGPASAITVTYLVPGFAMFWGALVLDEVVTTNMVVGCAVIFVGTALPTGLLPRNKAS